MISNLDFHLDDGGLEAFPALPLTLKGPCDDDTGHLPDLDFLKALHTGDVEGPTSSSSDADGSSARASEATPGQQEYQYGCAVSSVHSSWHMAPQLVSVHADEAPASAPVMYGTQAQQHHQWHQQPAIWHSAFAGAVQQQQQPQQQTSKGELQAVFGLLAAGTAPPGTITWVCSDRLADTLYPLRSSCCAESKVTVSHSTIEKQRRDRINSLIDEVGICSCGTLSGWAVVGPAVGSLCRPC